MINILDKVVEETSQDNMDLTTINQKQYTAALVITNKILPPKPQYKKTQRQTTSMAAETPETNRPTKG